MPKPVRIIIDIADEELLDWDAAHDLWNRFFRNNTSGHNGGRNLTYNWWKETPLPSGKFYTTATKARDIYAELAELKEQIDALEKAVYRLKRKSGIPKTDNTIIPAMLRNVKSLYSRWNAIDAQNAQVSELAG